MRKKKIITIQCSVVLILVVFFFRYQIVNKIQTNVLKNVNGTALSSNDHLLAGNDFYFDHKIRSLKGVEKILPHRVNSLERFEYLYDDFKGFECDIIIDPLHNVFRIAHDPEEISSLSFNQFLERDNDKKLFWMDVKNLDTNTMYSFCKHLNFLNSKYNLKERAIIESGNSSLLKQIADSGYLTSLYFHVNDSLMKLSESADISSYILNTDGLLSQDVFWLKLMNENYPRKKKIVWDISFYTSLNAGLLKKYIEDTTILLCLINIKSPAYR